MRVLIIDDEKNIRTTLAVCVEGLGCEVRSAADGAAGLAEAARGPFELAFVDLRLGNESGLDLVPRLLAASPGIAIVIVTAYAEFDVAVDAVKRGAWDFLPKPFTPAQIRQVVEKAAERRALGARVDDLERQLAEVVPEADVAPASPAMRAVLDTAARVAATDATVLLRGENGTGKGVIARLIHARSKRARKPFVVVNCPTLSAELLASELFGHARGAFTGAVKMQEGRVESVRGGTLFLDEIGDLSPTLQVKLLRFLQDKEFERVGENETRHADCRIVTATNRDLEEAVAAGRFREDLLYRLNVVEITIPPLRERKEDIVPLARRFLTFFGRAAGRADLDLSPSAAEALTAHAWPGNVRELRNVVERAVILWPAQILEREAFFRTAPVVASDPSLGGEHTLEAVEREHILRVLARTPTLEEAAKVLGIDASTLYRKRKKYEG